MKEFLQQHEGEVVDMVNFEWNQKDFEEAILEEGIERGRAEGRSEGRSEEKNAFVVELLKEKLPMETIAKVSKLSVEKIQELGRLHSLL